METSSIFYSVFALIFVLCLIGLISFAIRYFGGERFVRRELKGNKKKRISIIDIMVLDTKRKLVLIARDDVEHLILLAPDRETVIEHDIKSTTKRK